MQRLLRLPFFERRPLVTVEGMEGRKITCAAGGSDAVWLGSEDGALVKLERDLRSSTTAALTTSRAQEGEGAQQAPLQAFNRSIVGLRDVPLKQCVMAVGEDSVTHGLESATCWKYKAYSLYRTDQSTGRPCLLREARILAGAPQDEDITGFDVSADLTVLAAGTSLGNVYIYRSRDLLTERTCKLRVISPASSSETPTRGGVRHVSIMQRQSHPPRGRENRGHLSNGADQPSAAAGAAQSYLFIVYDDGAVASYSIEGVDGGVTLLDVDPSCCIGDDESASSQSEMPVTGGCAPFPSMGSLLVLSSKGAVFGFDPNQGNIAAVPVNDEGSTDWQPTGLYSWRSYFVLTTRQVRRRRSSDVSDPILAGQKSEGKAAAAAAHRQGPVKCGVTVVLMYPNANVRFIAFQGVFSDFSPESGIVAVVPAFDRSLLVVGNNASTGNPCVYSLHEKAITEEVSMLQQKGLYEWAVEIATREELPVNPYLTQLYTKYGLSLLEKNQVENALRVFIKAAADLRLPIQTSTVIEAFRIRHRVPAIATFLLRLHEAEAVKKGPDGQQLRPILLYKEHTYMLMKCLCRLGDYRSLERLVELLTRKDCDIPLDVTTAIDILLTGGYPKLASHLALSWGGEGTTASAAELYVGTCLEADDGDSKRTAAIEYLKDLIDRGQDAAVISVLTSSRGIGRSLMHANAEGMMPLLETLLDRHPVIEDEKASSDLAPATETPGPDSLSTPIEASLSQLLLPTEACAGMLLRHLSKKSRSSKSNSSSLLPPLCLELCLGCGLHRKDEATRLRMTDTLFDRNLGDKAQTMAEACFQIAGLNGVIALIESSYTRPEDARAFARALFDTADPADLTPASYVEVCNAVTDGPAGKTTNKKLDEVTRKLWLQALRKLRRRAVEVPRDRTEALQAMNEIVGTLSRCCSGSPTVTSEVLDALALDPAVEEDSGTMVEMGTLKPMIRALLKGTGERCATSLDNLQQDKEELQRMRQEVESLRTTARVFNGGEGGGSPKCAECGQRMDLPAVHFMCMHSFHQLCLSSGDSSRSAEDEYTCPVCQPEATYKEGMRKEREESMRDPEALSNLYKAIGASPEDFSIVADYLGRGLFHTTTT
ncbi:Vacuolar protein sorting-associated protein 11 [Perkinsus olseni]|uniref:Vacuolar protein sorting-associated protein 11 n=1 Tax=Perkinsus olseni TaxID=32597 RepID=A0A7J6LB75_PEROL|nr:Vacuolar protein sorting-associated protein 11 [Perkinsus olseni]